MPRKYFVLDVFTSKPLAGNPLAVVLDCEGLDSQDMQKIALEFNLSETVFVLPPQTPGNRAHIRIFTPAAELPFAGHPTVGTAVLLATLDGLPESGGTLVLEEEVGLVTCEASGVDGSRSVRFALPKLPEKIEWEYDRSLIAKALGLPEASLGFGNQDVAAWDGGIPYIMVPIKSLEDVRAIRIDTTALYKIDRSFDGHLADLYAYAGGGDEPGTDYHARMFAPEHGVPEDPATGSAVSSFCGQLAAVEMGDDDARIFVIEQGYEMGRPSKILLDVEKKSGTVSRAGIRGDAVIVAEGKLFV